MMHHEQTPTPSTGPAAARSAEVRALADGVIYELADDLHPTRVRGWRGGRLALPDEGTHFGYVAEGRATLSSDRGAFPLRAGFFFSHDGAATLSGSGRAFVSSRLGYRGAFYLGGPVSKEGRLRYINGATDSVLVFPLTHGDPCLNMLFLPPRVDQTAHTHPSIRVGMVIDGRGVCRTPHGPEPLVPGTVFLLRRDAVHSFHTADDCLHIVVYHPDSDFGPTHDDHPMLNRTLVEGRGVASMTEIRTR